MSEWSCQLYGNYLGLWKENVFYISGKLIIYQFLGIVQHCAQKYHYHHQCLQVVKY